MNRRSIIAMFAKAPVVAAISGRAVAQEAAAKLAGVAVGPGGALGVCVPQSSSAPEPSQAQWRMAMHLPQIREHVRSVIFEEQQHVGYIDADIAVLRSFSLNAKVTYQRQRNVERRLYQLQHEWPWQRMNTIVSKAIGLFRI